MPRISIDGAMINVETAGSGPPLVLLHGFTGSAASWDGHMDAFANRYRVAAVDLIGHGQSDAPADPGRYTIAHEIEDVIGVLDHLAMGRVALAGYSMGGRVALATAIAAPDRCSALILESASPGIADPEGRVVREAQDNEMATSIIREGIEPFVGRWERQPIFASQAALPDSVRAGLRAQRLRNNPVGLANSLRGMGQGAQLPMHAFLGEIRVPTLLIAGALDEKYRMIATQMQAIMPGAVLEIVDGAGHAVHLEQPETFRRLVLDFLGRIHTSAAAE
jgi:2-succinyl-6-hydroxy-2,4-cyclohexadiene-1-carboxylate synthase